MDSENLVASILTSAAVSGLLVFVLKTYFKARIEQVYKIELEKLKSELAIKRGEDQAFLSRRVEAYPALVEMIYRTRNMARDLAKSISSRNLSLVSEVAARAKELEELLYKYRIDLERDDQFNLVHCYKNLLLTFTMRTSDVKYFLEHEESERADGARADTGQLYEELEALYGKIVHELSLANVANKGAFALDQESTTSGREFLG